VVSQEEYDERREALDVAESQADQSVIAIRSLHTPEVDQELAQAQAQLKVARAALHLAEVTRRRNLDLFSRKVVAAQDYDTATDSYRENQAIVMADQANINRLEALEAFKIIRAPFTGG
jgi:multidrug efflux system membrane fusion protein